MVSAGELRIWIDKAGAEIADSPGAMTGIQAINQALEEARRLTLLVKKEAEALPHQTITRLPSYAEVMKTSIRLIKLEHDEKMLPLCEPVLAHVERAMHMLQAAADGTQNEQLKTASAMVANAKTKLEEARGVMVSSSAIAGDLMIIPVARLDSMAQQLVGYLATIQAALETAFTSLLEAVSLIRSYIPGL